MLNIEAVSYTHLDVYKRQEMTIAGSRATIRDGSQYTSTFLITTGVRQGDALSSLLFNLVLAAAINKMEIRDT